MALKDIGKIVANQVGREDALAEANSAMTPAGRQWSRDNDAASSSIKPGTNKPADTSGHRGFKYQGGNPFHKDVLKSLMDSGNLGKAVIHDGGNVSVPKDVAYGLGKKFELATDFAPGGETRYASDSPKPAAAVMPAARKSEKDSKTPSIRPSAPKPASATPVQSVAKNIASDPKSEVAALFVGGGTRVGQRAIDLENQRKASADAADKAERAKLRKERLAED